MDREQLDRVVRRAQRKLADIALRLDGFEDLLLDVYASLPEPPIDQLEHRLPYDVRTEMHGTLECLLDDYLRPLVDDLFRLSKVTLADLVHDWRTRQNRDPQ